MKKTVLLTGATGNMGNEALKQLYANKDKYNIVLFALPTKRDKRILKPYTNDKSVKIVWGDLTNYNHVKKCVLGTDIILHVGALVSPLADRFPKLAWQINFGGTKNIVDAIIDNGMENSVKLMYVGTVAETGNRAVPVHWGRVGDPLVPSVYDYYALSKIAAERYVIESGIHRWVSVRQTGIFHKRLCYCQDGIEYHQPLNTHMEWVTAEDSGRLLHNICSKDIKNDFWNNVYNIGGGQSCRFTAYQFYKKLFDAMGVSISDVYEPNMFALRNFHGQYYLDSDKLNDYTHFRSYSVDDALIHLKKNLPFLLRILRHLPKKMIKRIMTNKSIKNPITPLYWIKHNDTDKINAFFGTKEKWKGVGDWDEFKHTIDPPHILLNHGYDEDKKDSEITLIDVQKAAEFRGGKCLSTTMKQGDLNTKLRFVCSEGHEFEASPYLVLKTGHWCQECLKPPWNFDEQAKKNPFLAQVWYSDHEKHENNVYL